MKQYSRLSSFSITSYTTIAETTSSTKPSPSVVPKNASAITILVTIMEPVNYIHTHTYMYVWSSIPTDKNWYSTGNNIRMLEYEAE